MSDMSKREAAQILDDAWHGKYNAGSINEAYRLAISALRDTIPRALTLEEARDIKPLLWLEFRYPHGIKNADAFVAGALSDNEEEYNREFRFWGGCEPSAEEMANAPWEGSDTK